MKSLRNVFACLALCAAAGTAAGTAAAEPATLSFADVYRLTVAGPLAAESAPGAGSNPSEALPPRVAEGEGYVFTVVAARTGGGRPPAAYQFSVGALPEPQHWLLLLSGLALAAWVARRRLFYSL
jgi:hypothetical protein